MLYSELIPAAERKSRRLMVMLHGLGDSLEGFRWLPEALDLPWLNYLLVNAPDDYYGGHSWFELDDPAPGVRRSRQLLSALLDDLRAKGFPADQMTVSGFSQGCLMSVEVGLSYPQVFAGIVGISGWVWEPETLLREMPGAALRQRLLLTHGTADPLLPIAKTRAQIPLLQAAGLNVTWREFAKAHTIAGEPELAVIREFIRAGYSEKF
jgi:phospholipase/carboxylesterase